MDYRKIIKGEDYEFLRSNPRLKDNIILLTLGGSHAYGTNIEGSDLDIRGITTTPKENLIGFGNFEQVIDNNTDTTIYSFDKIIKLLLNCNPNTIEMLGCKPEHYLVMSDIGKELLNNRKLFLSKKAIHSFGGYATSQLRRLENKANRTLSQAEKEKHILDTIKNARYDLKERYLPLEDDCINLYLDTAIDPELDKEIFIDTTLHHYPLRDYKNLISEFQGIIRSYEKVGHRNQNAMDHKKLSKHMMHLIRLYLMCLDILEKEEIVTYREKDHYLLMNIRNGKYLDSNDQPISEFYEMVNDFEKKLEYAKVNTCLPDNPDFDKIQEFVMDMHMQMLKKS